MADIDAVTNQTRLTAEICLEIALKKAENGKLISGLWYVGVILSILSSVASNLGVNVQKYSMMKEIASVKKKRLLHENKDGLYIERPYIRQPLWSMGLLFVILGAVGDFVALGFAAQTLATPVGGFTIVVNVFFGHFWLKESINRRDIFATGLVLAGVVLVAVSADKTDKTYTLDCLLKLYQRIIFIVYIVTIVSISFLLLIATQRLARLREFQPHSPTYQRLKRVHPICPAALSGLLGSQSVLFAKCTAEMFKVTFTGSNQFNRWETYVIILCMIVTIVNQLHWLAHGLRYFDAVLIVPIFQCFFITGGVVGGAVFFDEFRGLENWEIAIFVGGVVVTIIGVYILSCRDHEVELTTNAGAQVNPIIDGKDDHTKGLLRRSHNENDLEQDASMLSGTSAVSAFPELKRRMSVMKITDNPQQAHLSHTLGFSDSTFNASSGNAANLLTANHIQNSETRTNSFLNNDSSFFDPNVTNLTSASVVENARRRSVNSATHEDNGFPMEIDIPPAPVPLSLQVPQLAVSDLFQALKEEIRNVDLNLHLTRHSVHRDRATNRNERGDRNSKRESVLSGVQERLGSFVNLRRLFQPNSHHVDLDNANGALDLNEATILSSKDAAISNNNENKVGERESEGGEESILLGPDEEEIISDSNRQLQQHQKSNSKRQIKLAAIAEEAEDQRRNSTDDQLVNPRSSPGAATINNTSSDTKGQDSGRGEVEIEVDELQEASKSSHNSSSK